ncbi:MAG: hypothetical protein WBD36_08545 [Bacteroidota bacterium]
MKTRSFFVGLTLLAVLAVIISVDGCKKDDATTNPGVTPITDDLFPLTVGHQIKFSGYLRHQTADTNITATGAVYYTTWFVASNNAPTPVGGTANLIYDTTQVPTGIANPPTTKVITPLFIQRTSATGSGNFSFLQNIGRFYRTFGITRSDSLRWILIAKLDEGIGVEWTGFDSTWATAVGNVQLKIVGKFVGTESITVGGSTFTAYKLTAVRRVSIGGAAQPESPTATFWLVKDVGPVKVIIDADGESYGHYREFKSKNF